MLRRSFSAVALVILTTVAAPAAASASFPGTNGAIAFTRHHHVWVIEPDGTQTKLARGYSPAWSPDGTRIAYVHQNPRTGNADIFTMQADGTDKVRVVATRYYDSAPEWSPDGSTLVYVGLASTHESWELWTIGAEPPFGSPFELTHTDVYEDNPAWSPDGTSIAFSIETCCYLSRIGTVAPDGQDYTLITPDLGNGAYETQPDWSPDSATLLFQSNRADPTSTDFDVYSIAPTGGQATRITTGVGAEQNGSPAWSPDGTRFAYVHRSADGRVSLWTAAPDGTAAVRLCRSDPDSFYDPTLGTLWNDAAPDWQPLP